MLRYTLLSLNIIMLLLGTGAAYAQSNLAVIDARISELEQEIRRLTGKVEEQGFKIKQLENEVERRISDAEIRMNDLEKNTSSSSSGSNSIAPQNEGATSWQTPDTSSQNLGQIGGDINSATAQYEQAFATLRNGNYDLAEQQFQSFLDNNSASTLSNNARYWLAETYYVRNQYDRAAKGFATAYQNDPQGPKAPDNLLKLGLSLAGLDKSEDACVALSQLLTDFSNGPKTIVGRAKRESIRLGC